MTEDISRQIDSAYEKLRSIDDELSTFGRSSLKRHISNEAGGGDFTRNGTRISFGGNSDWDDRRLSSVTISRDVSNNGFSKRKIHVESERDRSLAVVAPVPSKRSRVDYLEENAAGEVEIDEEHEMRPKRTIQSTVVMPSLDSKGREQKIEKMKETENKAVTTRNRRMFSNLLMGTLNSFKKSAQATTNIQIEKQAEVEKRLEEKKREDMEKRQVEKQALFEKRRDQEKELKALQRKRALIQYAEGRIEQLKRMSNFIESQAEPKVFFQPTKHTLRSMELLQISQKKIEKLIDERREQLEKELAAGETHDNTRKEPADGDHYDDENDQEVHDGSEDRDTVEVVVVPSGASKRSVAIDDGNGDDDENVDDDEGNDDEEDGDEKLAKDDFDEDDTNVDLE